MDKLTWIIVGVIYIAILYSLVRPGSKGTQTVNQIFTFFTDLVRGATGQTYADGKWSAGGPTDTGTTPVNAPVTGAPTGTPGGAPLGGNG